MSVRASASCPSSCSGADGPKRADDGAVSRQWLPFGRHDRLPGARHRDGRLRLLRQAEVEELHLRCIVANRAGFGQHDVAGFQIAMDDALAMRLVERVGDLDRDLERIGKLQRSVSREPVGERLPLQVFHDEEVDPVLGADVVERADVWMVQAGRQCALRARSAPGGRVMSDRCAGKTLMATLRSNRVSRAR